MTDQVTERRVEYTPLALILAAPRNPKRHATDEIKTSINRFGLAELPLVDERTGRLVAGHGRLDDLAARRAAGEDPPDGIRVHPKTGEWLVPVNRGWASRSDADAEAYVLASNNLTTLGGWDNPLLAETLRDLAAADATLLEVTGWTPDDLEDMLRLLEPPDLDQLGKDLGDPDPADMWPIVRFKVPPHVAAAWRSHVDTHQGDEPAALAALLDVDPEQPPESDWTP